MGQVQRRTQRDVALWDLDGEESRSGRKVKNGQGRPVRRHTGSAGNGSMGNRAAANRNGSRQAREDDRRSGRNGRGVSAAGYAYGGQDRNAGHGRGVQGKKAGRPLDIMIYDREQGTSGTKARTAGSAGRAPVRRSGSGTGGASRISYIQPYAGAGQGVRGGTYGYKGNARPVQSIRRRRARRRREILCRILIILMMAACLAMIYYMTGQIYRMMHRDKVKVSLPSMAEQPVEEEPVIGPPEMIQDLLEVNEYSRPGDRLDRVNSIFVHYTANPGTSAAQNRSYFANLAQTHERSASAHLIIGYEGELIQCIPFDEQAYAVMTRNEDSISIECCYLSEDGSFTQETYDTLIHTLAWLLDEFDLSTEDILRHYDCGGKLCPLYYAQDEDAWEQLKRDVAAYMADAGQDAG